jgi:lipopolysaccharide/colanic/teichoic acid biosynthesis glycosyltransferase
VIGCWRISVNRYLLVAHSPASAHSEHDSFSSAARTKEADANRSNVMKRFMAVIMSRFCVVFDCSFLLAVGAV